MKTDSITVVSMNERLELLTTLMRNDYPQQVERVAELIINCFSSKNKVLTVGNGGSAADAQHFAAELIGRFERERMPFPALALTTDSSIVTSLANDYGFEQIFSRQVEALGIPGDILVCFSTSGNSTNLLHAARSARKQAMLVIGLLGRDGGALMPLCDVALVIPSDTTAYIQEFHEMTLHCICRLVDSYVAMT